MEPIDILLLGGAAWLLWSVYNPAPLASLVQTIETGVSDVVTGVEEVTGGIMNKTYSAAVIAFARAAAVAEGFYVPGSIPQRANNPGDLMMGDVPLGVATNGTLGAGIAVFVNLEDGWNALYRKFDRILSGQSASYDPNWSISSIAHKYTATQQDEWAHNFSSALGVTPDTTLADAAQRYA